LTDATTDLTLVASRLAVMSAGRTPQTSTNTNVTNTTVIQKLNKRTISHLLTVERMTYLLGYAI
jgi:hypothetical protein